MLRAMNASRTAHWIASVPKTVKTEGTAHFRMVFACAKATTVAGPRCVLCRGRAAPRTEIA